MQLGELVLVYTFQHHSPEILLLIYN